MKQLNNETNKKIKIELTFEELDCITEMIDQYLACYADDEDIDEDLRKEYDDVCSKIVEIYNFHYEKINK